MKIARFEDLEIWKLSTEIAVDIYKITNRADFSKDFGLSDQIRRAVVSISSNIVEGFEMSNNNDFIRFLRIAKGSAGEVRSQLYLAKLLDYINQDEYQRIGDKLVSVSLMIGKFMTYLIGKKNAKEFSTR